MIQAWAIIITKSTSSEPALYFNHVRNKWVDEFQGGCAFFDEKSARDKLNQINVDGAKVVSGSVK